MMPEVDRCGGGVKGMVLYRLHWIEIASTVTSEHLLARMKILYGKSMRIEFNRNIIVTG